LSTGFFNPSVLPSRLSLHVSYVDRNRELVIYPALLRNSEIQAQHSDHPPSRVPEGTFGMRRHEPALAPRSERMAGAGRPWVSSTIARQREAAAGPPSHLAT